MGECFIFHLRTSIRFPWRLWQREKRQNRGSGCWCEIKLRGATRLAAALGGQICPWPPAWLLAMGCWVVVGPPCWGPVGGSAGESSRRTRNPVAGVSRTSQGPAAVCGAASCSVAWPSLSLPAAGMAPPMP